MTAIPEAFHDLFEKETIAHVATLTESGAPHVTPVWIDYDEETGELLINTERGRQKERNLRSNPSVGVSMTDPEDPYRYVSVIGEVTGFATDGAREHIDELSQRYVGTDYRNTIETERVIVRIRPERVF